MLLTLFGRSFFKIEYRSFPLFPAAYPFRIATQLQYYVKREKCKVNDVIFPSGCEAHTINLGNKNVKIGIFTGGTSVRSKNIFTDISRYLTGKHDINQYYLKCLENTKDQITKKSHKHLKEARLDKQCYKYLDIFTSDILNHSIISYPRE